MSDLIDTPKACIQCGLDIPMRASYCTHCQSYQDLRRWFPVSTTVLALLTALISVVSATGPSFYHAIHTPRSKLTLMPPAIDGTTLRIVVINQGDAPAAFLTASVQSQYLAGATKVRLRNDGDAIISPGSKLLTFDIVPLLTQDQSYRNSIEMIQLAIQGKEALPTRIALELTESDGKRLAASFPLTVDDLFFLMRANADRCSAIKEPDLLNGCIGPGDISMGDPQPRQQATESK